MTAEKKKEIQRDRMKKYFIESAKELIKEEGLSNLTTKKIGDRAGYSYATIYNYFTNFNELICVCLEEFSEEMKEFLEKNSKDLKNDTDILKEITKIAVNYSVNNINIYSLFLTNSIDFNYFKVIENSRFVHPAYNLLVKIIKNIPDFSHLSDIDVHCFADLVMSLFHSKMQFFIVMKYPENLEELEEDILKNLDFLIKSVKL